MCHWLWDFILLFSGWWSHRFWDFIGNTGQNVTDRICLKEWLWMNCDFIKYFNEEQKEANTTTLHSQARVRRLPFRHSGCRCTRGQKNWLLSNVQLHENGCGEVSDRLGLCYLSIILRLWLPKWSPILIKYTEYSLRRTTTRLNPKKWLAAAIPRTPTRKRNSGITSNILTPWDSLINKSQKNYKFTMSKFQHTIEIQLLMRILKKNLNHFPKRNLKQNTPQISNKKHKKKVN